MVGDGMQKNIKAGALLRGNRDDRDAQHFRQTMEIDFHAPLFHHIHHIQRHDNRLSQFQKLQGEIQVSLQGGCIHHIHNDVNFVA